MTSLPALSVHLIGGAHCIGCRTFWDYFSHFLEGLAVALVVLGLLWWWYLRPGARSAGRRRIRTQSINTSKPITDSIAAKGITLVIDQQQGGGYTAWSTDDSDINVDAPTLDAIDEKVRQSIRQRLVGHHNTDLSIAYVWKDDHRIAAAIAGDGPAVDGERPPKSAFLEVREQPGGGYTAEGSGLRVRGATLEALAQATRQAIVARWPSLHGKNLPEVTYSWVRSVKL